MRPPWRLRFVLPGLGLLGIGAAACSMSDAATAGLPDRNGSSSSSSSGGLSDAGSAPANGSETGDLGPTDNAVILVHAAGMPAVRVCFGSALDQRPQPDQETLPEANVVGVEVGSAVRLPPLASGAPGKVWIYNESLIRQYVGTGQSCRSLLDDPNIPAYEMPAITTDYAKGVHLLVLRGCQGKTPLTTRSKEECGQDYDPLAEGTPTAAKGNLSLLDIELKGAYRTDTGALPTQVLHLSQALESSRNGDELAVTFGDVTKDDSFHASSAINPELFAEKPADLGPESPKFGTTDEAVYVNLGFRVVLKGSSTTVVAQQSLADTQKLSAPRDIPSTYYSVASNYVLLLLGSPAEAQKPDGGDPRKGVHLLAVPVVDPEKFDGGAGDAGPAIDGGAGDGGS